jgi:predicted enzyme related to lactoylglutathione lyase
MRVVHFEIPADDPESLTKFYGELFDWKIEEMAPDADYWLCDTGEGDGINGAIMKRQAPQHPLTNYIQVESVDEWADKATSLGATVMVPKQAVPQMGWFAQIVDPQGNVVGLWQNDPNAA